MTSDAKIGLLLGLVFIFIIAFIINGLPNFTKHDNNELTTTMVSSGSRDLGIGKSQRDATRKVISQPVPQPKSQTPAMQTNPSDIHGIRYQAQLPTAVQTNRPGPLVTAEPAQTPAVSPVAALQTEPQAPVVLVEEPVSENRVITVQPEPKPRTKLPKYYTVQSGDSLASIAKKFYGPQEGNRRINIKRIFQVNRKQLHSIDDIYVGQKLVIPPLPHSADSSSDSSGLFEKVASIGQPKSDSNHSSSTRIYVVQEGDSLWKIAEKQLGNGNRFPEIAKLNANRLSDEDSLFVGMRLKLPAK